MLSGSWDNTVRLWDVANGKCLRSFEGHTDWVNSVAFSPDGRQAASGSEDGTIRLWQVETGDCLHVLLGNGQPIASVAWSTNSTKLLAASGTLVQLWHVDWELLPEPQ